MEKTLEQLQQELIELKEHMEAERSQLAAQYKEERDNMILAAEAESKRRWSENEERIEASRRKMREQAEAVEKQRQLLQAETIKAQTAAALADEQKRLHAEKIEWLNKHISDVEFSEEQHKKALENLRLIPQREPEYLPTEINVEHPVAPVNVSSPGEAVDGTAGLEQGPAMSVHLKQILRQATRTY